MTNFFFESYKELLNLYETTNDIQELEKLLDVIQDLFKDKEKINVIKFYKSMLLNRNKKFVVCTTTEAVCNVNYCL